MATSDEDKADVLGSFFSGVFTREPVGPVPRPDRPPIEHPLESPHFTVSQVAKKLHSLNPSKAPGPDGAHPRVLKELDECIAPALTEIFETSLQTKTVPDEWKRANVSAIFKKGDRKVAGNYRPVSLTSVIGKILESLQRDCLIDHLRRNNILSKQQFGFLSGRSASLQLLRVLDEWTQQLDDGREVDVVYMDFKKAFDSVPHERLLAKLEGYGVTDPMLGWIRSFLSDRTQRVVVRSAASPWRPVTSGIPQGSVLGPVLFVIFINDLPGAVESSLYLFADDSKISRPILSALDRDILQQDLNKMHSWSEDWLLSFHPEKCKVMTVSIRWQGET